MPDCVDINHALLLIQRLSNNKQDYLIYGAGEFTRQLVPLIEKCALPPPRGIIDDNRKCEALSAIPVCTLEEARRLAVTTILLGTDTHQKQMKENIWKVYGDHMDPLDLTDLPEPYAIDPAGTTNPPANIFHCSANNPGSRWVHSILTDWRTLYYAKMTCLDIRDAPAAGTSDEPNRDEKQIPSFPKGTIVSPLDISYTDFISIPKQGDYRAFYVLLDPHEFNILGYSENQNSWINTSSENPSIILLRHDELTGPRKPLLFKQLFDFCGIHLPDALLCMLLKEHSFSRLPETS